MAKQSGHAKESTRSLRSRQDVIEVKQKILGFFTVKRGYNDFCMKLLHWILEAINLDGTATMSFYSDFDSTPMAVYILAVLISIKHFQCLALNYF